MFQLSINQQEQIGIGVGILITAYHQTLGLTRNITTAFPYLYTSPLLKNRHKKISWILKSNH